MGHSFFPLATKEFSVVDTIFSFTIIIQKGDSPFVVRGKNGDSVVGEKKIVFSHTKFGMGGHYFFPYYKGRIWCEGTLFFHLLQVATALLVAGSTLTFWIPWQTPFTSTSSRSNVVQSARLLVGG